jgi:predicted dinucleotide-binding enzyme
MAVVVAAFSTLPVHHIEEPAHRAQERCQVARRAIASVV